MTDEKTEYQEQCELAKEIYQKHSIYFNDSKFSACLFAGLLTYKDFDETSFTGENRGYVVINDKDREILRYDNGIYVNAESFLRGLIHKILGKKGSESRTIEVLNCIKNDAVLKIKREQLNSNVNLICVKNGILDIKNNKLLPYSKNVYITNKLDIIYNPDAKCPNIIKFFSEVLQPDQVKSMFQLFGYCLYRKYDFNHAFFFNGSGRNGKTTTMNLLYTFIGNKNISAIGLGELTTDRFGLSQLYGKLANISGDIGSGTISDTQNLKKATGNDWITVQFKFKHPFDFKNHAKLIYACNKLPMFKFDDSDALYERIIVFYFPNQFMGKDAKDNTLLLKELTTEEEMSGLFNQSINGLQELLTKKDFDCKKTNEETRKSYNRLADPIGTWCKENYEFSDSYEDRISKNIVFKGYADWCKINKQKLPSLQTFYACVRNAIPGVVDGIARINDEQVRVFRFMVEKGCTENYSEKNEKGADNTLVSNYYTIQKSNHSKKSMLSAPKHDLLGEKQGADFNGEQSKTTNFEQKTPPSTLEEKVQSLLTSIDMEKDQKIEDLIENGFSKAFLEECLERKIIVKNPDGKIVKGS